MELPRSLRRRGASEAHSMTALLAREAARIQWCAARAPERMRLLKVLTWNLCSHAASRCGRHASGQAPASC